MLESHLPRAEDVPTLEDTMDHPEIDRWERGVHRFSRFTMVLAAAVLAGVAQLIGAAQGNERAGWLLLVAMVFSLLAIAMGYLVERLALGDAVNRFGSVFGKGSTSFRAWGMYHRTEVAGGSVTLGKGLRAFMSPSLIAGKPHRVQWILRLQAVAVTTSISLYALAVGLLLLPAPMV